ncbi:conserved hypothetical protein [Ixodes scapularis]|uniref:Uncharacterized protein n=1 Tax=Ixodes scapularis TaxID=6945 RepID=B7Q3J5_IXOSC|nr:conserved hypothetical protein [Ixodes scapularis]|eukprot:XP_002411293.1 conserved hypothetical protein [Ixodes scapularis]
MTPPSEAPGRGAGPSRGPPHAVWDAATRGLDLRGVPGGLRRTSPPSPRETPGSVPSRSRDLRDAATREVPSRGPRKSERPDHLAPCKTSEARRPHAAPPTGSSGPPRFTGALAEARPRSAAVRVCLRVRAAAPPG